MLETETISTHTCIIHRQTLVDEKNCDKCPEGTCKDKLKQDLFKCLLCKQLKPDKMSCPFCLQCDRNKCFLYVRLPYYCHFCNLFFKEHSERLRQVDKRWIFAFILFQPNVSYDFLVSFLNNNKYKVDDILQIVFDYLE